MKQYIPDEPEEIAFIATSISRLGSALAGLSLFANDKAFTLAAVVITWIGVEVSQYIHMHDQNNNNPNT